MTEEFFHYIITTAFSFQLYLDLFMKFYIIFISIVFISKHLYNLHLYSHTTQIVLFLHTKKGFLIGTPFLWLVTYKLPTILLNISQVRFFTQFNELTK